MGLHSIGTKYARQDFKEMVLYHVRSINHNIPVGAGFGDGRLLAGIVGELAPTKIAIAQPDMILDSVRSVPSATRFASPALKTVCSED